ncbi:GIY-YIG nuclease family protein [Gemmatimonadota bacterium]
MRLSIGKLETFTFPSGIYIYTGSARGGGGLYPRLKRHLAGPDKLHWHIDYLSVKAVNKSFYVVRTEKPLECELNRAVASLPGSRIVAPGFGSSDCRCRSHLHYLVKSARPDFPGLEPWPESFNEV